MWPYIHAIWAVVVAMVFAGVVFWCSRPDLFLRKTVAGLAIFGVVAYSLIAWRFSVLNPRVISRYSTEIELKRNFENVGGTHAFLSWARDLDHMADSPTNETPSPFVIYEDETPLGPAHSPYREVREKGEGRFVHWVVGFIFSSSDNSDPNTNGRRYRAIIP